MCIYSDWLLLMFLVKLTELNGYKRKKMSLSLRSPNSYKYTLLYHLILSQLYKKQWIDRVHGLCFVVLLLLVRTTSSTYIFKFFLNNDLVLPQQKIRRYVHRNSVFTLQDFCILKQKWEDGEMQTVNTCMIHAMVLYLFVFCKNKIGSLVRNWSSDAHILLPIRCFFFFIQ